MLTLIFYYLIVRLLFNLSLFLNSNQGCILQSSIIFPWTVTVFTALWSWGELFLLKFSDRQREVETREEHKAKLLVQQITELWRQWDNYYEYLNQLLSSSNPVLSCLLLELTKHHQPLQYLTTNGACLHTDLSGTDELEKVLSKSSLPVQCRMWMEKWYQNPVIFIGLWCPSQF